MNNKEFIEQYNNKVIVKDTSPTSKNIEYRTYYYDFIEVGCEIHSKCLSILYPDTTQTSGIVIDNDVNDISFMLISPQKEFITITKEEMKNELEESQLKHIDFVNEIICQL